METFEKLWGNNTEIHLTIRYSDLKNLIESVEYKGEHGKVSPVGSGGSHRKVTLPFPFGISETWEPHGEKGRAVPRQCVQLFRRAFENAGFGKDSPVQQMDH
jgi:hypothetical protein